MASATLNITADASQAKKTIDQVGKDLDKLNKTREKGKKPSGGGNTGNGGKTGTDGSLGGKKGAGGDSMFGFSMNLKGAVAALGGFTAALAAVKNIDVVQNFIGEMKAGLKGLMNPGEGADVALDNVGAWADKGRQYRMTAQEAYSAEQSMKMTYGTEKGGAMLEKVDSYVSDALVNGNGPLKQLIRGFKMPEKEVNTMKTMNAKERFDFLMQKARNLNNPDRAAAALMPVLGAKNVGEAKGNIGEYENLQANYARFMSMSGNVLSPERVAFAEGAGDLLDFQRQRTFLSGLDVSPYQAKAAIDNEASKTRQTVNFNAKADDRGWLFGGDTAANTYFQNNIPKQLTREDYSSGVNNIVEAINSGKAPQAVNNQQPATFQ